jgi:CubicO group peptidase (beta-lactamase class C family)
MIVSMLVSAGACTSLQDKAFAHAAGLPGNNSDMIASYLGYFEERDEFSGVVVVAGDTDLVYSDSFGMADYGKQLEHSTDTLYHIGSITKMFTAAAVLRCQSMGLLSLDDTLDLYIPEYRHASQTTLRQMLSNSSGIPDYSLTPWFFAHLGTELSFPDFLRFVNKRKLKYQPGTSWNYSNLNFILAGEVVRRASGISLPVFLKEQFWDKLGMEHTVWDTGQHLPGRAQGYKALGGRPRMQALNDLYMADAAGNILSSAGDMLIWIRSIDTGPALTDTEREQMFTMTGRIDERLGYGLGCWLDWREFEETRYMYISHSGGVNGFSTMVSINRELHLYTVILTNYRTWKNVYKEEAIEAGIARLILDN